MSSSKARHALSISDFAGVIERMGLCCDRNKRLDSRPGRNWVSLNQIIGGSSLCLPTSILWQAPGRCGGGGTWAVLGEPPVPSSGTCGGEGN